MAVDGVAGGIRTVLPYQSHPLADSGGGNELKIIQSEQVFMLLSVLFALRVCAGECWCFVEVYYRERM